VVIVGGVTDREFFTALMLGVDDVDAVLAAAIWERPVWQADGSCRDRPDVDFFPEWPRGALPARAVCRGCPVRVECTMQALELGEVGVWGGTTDFERELAREAGTSVEELLEDVDRVDADGKPCWGCGRLRSPLNPRGNCASCRERARRAVRH
jgi:WhiB family transcriptional regulator, redox-sensing transcriptional regulator